MSLGRTRWSCTPALGRTRWSCTPALGRIRWSCTPALGRTRWSCTQATCPRAGVQDQRVRPRAGVQDQDQRARRAGSGPGWGVQALFPRGHRTVARAWRGHGAGVARAIGHFFLGLGGAGVARACPVTPAGVSNRGKCREPTARASPRRTPLMGNGRRPGAHRHV
eukprot:gene8816-biopygen10685